MDLFVLIKHAKWIKISSTHMYITMYVSTICIYLLTSIILRIENASRAKKTT